VPPESLKPTSLVLSKPLVCLRFNIMLTAAIYYDTTLNQAQTLRRHHHRRSRPGWTHPLRVPERVSGINQWALSAIPFSSAVRGFRCTQRGLLSHKIHTPCSASQSRSPIFDSSNRRSNCHRIFARMRRISAYASCRPMQLRGPMLNGCEASRRSPANSGSPSQRWGRNSSGRWKLELERHAAYCCTATEV
jgi:hypothetical protein